MISVYGLIKILKSIILICVIIALLCNKKSEFGKHAFFTGVIFMIVLGLIKITLDN